MNAHNAVIIAEDNPRDRDYLLQVLADYEVTATTDGQEALAASKQDEVTQVISDIQMPGLNGIGFARMLWEKNPDARIIFWSQYDDEMYVRSLAEIIPPETVYGYVLKDNPAEILLKAVKAVFEDDQCWIDPKVRSVQARSQAPGSVITDAEYEALIDIALGLTDIAIARRRFLSRRGAQNRLKSLYAKLELDRELGEEATGDMLNLRARALSVALRRGLINPYILEQEEEKLHQWLQSEGNKGK